MWTPFHSAPIASNVFSAAFPKNSDQSAVRILILCNRIPWPRQDGGAIAMYQMISGLQKAGAEVHLLCFNTRKHHADLTKLPEFFHNLASFDTVDIETGVTAIGALKNLLFSRESYHVSRFRSGLFSAKLAALLQQHDFDAVQFELVHMATYLPVVKAHSRAVTIMRAHNIEHLIWQRLAEGEAKPMKKQYLRLLARRLQNFERTALKEFNLIVPITSQDAVFFHEAYPNVPVFVSPTGLDLENYPVDYSSMQWPSIFHLGSLNWMPNQEGLLWFLDEVWPIVLKTMPHLKFYIAGRDIPAFIRARATDSVIMDGAVPDAKAYMQQKGIMVVPLHSGSGMRIKIIEGMAMGKAIVATPVGAEGIAAKNGSEILIGASPEDFAGQIRRLVQNQEFYLTVGRNARTFAECYYDNTSLSERLLKEYEKLRVSQ
jgi:glycosyltransferase involved in cell wall biosynthesis